VRRCSYNRDPSLGPSHAIAKYSRIIPSIEINGNATSAPIPGLRFAISETGRS
jgi:hypothetical protein